MPPSEPNKEEQEEELAGDYQTPFSPPDDTDDPTVGDDGTTTYPTDPATDSGIQLEELYDEGPLGASEVGRPSPGAVIGYTPPTISPSSAELERE